MGEVVEADRGTHDDAGGKRGTELLLAAAGGRGEADRGADDAVGLLGEPEREHHHEAGGKQEIGRRALVVAQALHREGRRIGALDRGPDLIGGERGERHADEVHEVVARESEGERERAGENDDREDVDAQRHDERLEEHGQDGEAAEQEFGRVGADPGDPLGLHDGRALGALDHEEVEDGRERDAAVDAAEELVVALVVEGEDQTQQILHEEARKEGHDDGYENRHDHGERLGGVEVEPQIRNGRAARPDLVAGERGGAAEEFEHDRDGRGGGKAEGVEGVEQEDVADHHGREDDDHFLEGEVLGHENACAGDLHHA